MTCCGRNRCLHHRYGSRSPYYYGGEEYSGDYSSGYYSPEEIHLKFTGQPMVATTLAGRYAGGGGGAVVSSNIIAAAHVLCACADLAQCLASINTLQHC